MLEANFQDSQEGSQDWNVGNFNNICKAAPVKIIEMKGGKNNTAVCSTTDIEENQNL